MNRRYVEARTIKSIGWENGTLEVEYMNGSIYQYFDVSEEDYIKSLLGAIDTKIRRIGQSHRFSKISN